MKTTLSSQKQLVPLWYAFCNDQIFISQGFQAQPLINGGLSDSDMIPNMVRMLMLYPYLLTGQIDRSRPK
jgi:hypothetical protein